MKCKNETCDNEAKGNGHYCSPTCKTVYNRNKKRNKSTTVTPVTPTVTPVTPTVTPPKTVTPVTPTIEDKFATLDGGMVSMAKGRKSMTADKFKALKLKLPGGVSQPTGLPTQATGKLTARELSSGVQQYTGLDWLASPEYAETILRLLTWSRDRLKESGQAMPSWKYNL